MFSWWPVRLFLLCFCSAALQQKVVAQPGFKSLRENLGLAVNNASDQIVPVFGPDGLRLYFAQNSHPEGYYEIWHATIDSAGTWMPAERKANLRSSGMFNQTVFGAFADDWFLINGKFTLTKGSYVYDKGFSWYKADKNIFNPSKTLPFEIEGLQEQLKGGFANVFFHKGKKVLLVSMANPEKRDLFICYPADTTQWPIVKWKAPVLLQSGINTTFEESCPFLDASGRVLYFSSNRPGGYGSDDIYVSYALSDDLQQWTKPQNLGHRVNSNFSELYYTTYPGHPFAYFVSYKHSMGAGDIFRIRTEDTTVLPPMITQNNTNLPKPSAEITAKQTTSSSPAAPRPQNEIKPGQLPVESFSPNNITLLLDKSVSMSQSNRIDLLRKSANLMLGKLRYLDKVSLVTFGERANIAYATHAFNNADSLISLIARLQPDEGETFLNDGLQKAMAQATTMHIEGGNNEILIITDGYFSISDKTMQLLQANSQVKITFVLVDAGNIENNIKDYITRRLPLAKILTLTNSKKDDAVLLEHIKAQSAISK